MHIITNIECCNRIHYIHGSYISNELQFAVTVVASASDIAKQNRVVVSWDEDVGQESLRVHEHKCTRLQSHVIPLHAILANVHA